MKWNKVKTILIIIFLIINIFLIYYTFQKNATLQISDDQIKQIELLLRSNNIELKFSLPKKYEKTMRLNVNNEAYDSEQIAKKIMNTNIFSKKETINNQDIYENNNEKVTISTNGKITYESTNNTNIQQYYLEQFEMYIYTFIKKYMDISNYKTEYKYEENGIKKLGLKYIYDKKHEILNNHLEAEITENGNLKITHGMISPISYTNNVKQVSYIDSIVNLLSEIDTNQGIELQSITLGYCIDLIKNDNILKSGEANPTWKIVTNIGTLYFDAYTGIKKENI